MKLSKEDLKTKISNFGIDEDVKIELLEDVEDSFIEDSSNDVELTALQQKYDELREKYKSRFLSKDEKKEDEEKDEDLKEETVIDITEI